MSSTCRLLSETSSIGNTQGSSRRDSERSFCLAPSLSTALIPPYQWMKSLQFNSSPPLENSPWHRWPYWRQAQNSAGSEGTENDLVEDTEEDPWHCQYPGLVPHSDETHWKAVFPGQVLYDWWDASHLCSHVPRGAVPDMNQLSPASWTTLPLHVCVHVCVHMCVCMWGRGAQKSHFEMYVCLKCENHSEVTVICNLERASSMLCFLWHLGWEASAIKIYGA